MKRWGFLLLFTVFLFGCLEVENILNDFVNEITNKTKINDTKENLDKDEAEEEQVQINELFQEPLNIDRHGNFIHQSKKIIDNVNANVLFTG